MVTLQKSERREKHSNRVKITLKTGAYHSKVNESHSKKEWTSLQKREFYFFKEAHVYQLETKKKTNKQTKTKTKNK